MYRPDETTDQATPSRRPCLVDGCSCKDARIVSRRRAAYFAARARQMGQTADRVIAAEPEWSLPIDKPAETIGLGSQSLGRVSVTTLLNRQSSWNEL
jgi:hypothetical protein